MEKRGHDVAAALESAFSGHIESREVNVIVFSGVTAAELASAISTHPLILKPLLAACNIAARAIERDLGIKNVDTYVPRVSKEEAASIAGYLKSFLPDYMEIPALVAVDKCEFTDKEIRKRKGQWETEVVAAMKRLGNRQFAKRKFRIDGESYELDAAYPKSGAVVVGIDIKRVEARRDIHKRADEIINKATRLKKAYPNAKFGAVIYYPFATELVNVESRLRDTAIDAVVFAGQTSESIGVSVRILIEKLGVTGSGK